jgi:hypothetical protein
LIGGVGSWTGGSDRLPNSEDTTGKKKAPSRRTAGAHGKTNAQVDDNEVMLWARTPGHCPETRLDPPNRPSAATLTETVDEA